MTHKINLGLIYGGQSAEHEVSIQSSQNIIEALDCNKYNLILIGIGQNGQWYVNDSAQSTSVQINQPGNEVTLVSSPKGAQLIKLETMEVLCTLDVVFPILHGTYGEDGAIQGLLKMAGVPFVGSGVLGSSVGMDKDIMKRLLRDAGLPTPEFKVYYQHEVIDAERVIEELGGFPLFIKPANMGSSVGIHKVDALSEMSPALQDAFQYDHKVIIERGLDCREIECAVLGNTTPEASVLGEIIVQSQFYSYDAKYINAEGARLQIPAEIPTELSQEIRALAIKTFQVLNGEGLARVDFFLTPDQKVWVNEVNTMPGFTRISMYPKLWESSGLGYSDLIDRLIDLALDKAKRQEQLITQRS